MPQRVNKVVTHILHTVVENLTRKIHEMHTILRLEYKRDVDKQQRKSNLHVIHSLNVLGGLLKILKLVRSQSKLLQFSHKFIGAMVKYSPD